MTAALIQQQTKQDTAQVLKLGPARIYMAAYPTAGAITTVNYGYMSVKGATIHWAPKTVDAKVSKYGDTPVGTFYTGGELTLEFESSQTNFYIFSKTQISTALDSTDANGTPPPAFFPSGTGFGGVVGFSLTPQKIQLVPELAAGNPSPWTFTMHKAVPVGEPEIVYSGEGAENVYKVKFKALVAETQGATAIPDGSRLGFWGDASIY